MVADFGKRMRVGSSCTRTVDMDLVPAGNYRGVVDGKAYAVSAARGRATLTRLS